MKKNLYLLLFAFALAIPVHSQVTIGSLDAPHPGAVLELKSDKLGFLPPRIELDKLSSPYPLDTHVEGMIVFNIKSSPTDTLQAGLYYNSGSRWIQFSTAPFFTEKWFYMPSIPIDVSVTGTDFTIDLYQELKTQLNIDGGLVINSVGAPTRALSVLPEATDLYYYVTAYDKTVFDSLSIDAEGKMTYDIIGPATDATFMNIICVEK